MNMNGLNHLVLIPPLIDAMIMHTYDDFTVLGNLYNHTHQFYLFIYFNHLTVTLTNLKKSRQTNDEITNYQY